MMMKCILEKNKYIFPNVYEYMSDSLQSINKTVGKLFPLTVYNPCQDRFWLSDDQYDYMFFTNGSLYLSIFEIFAESTTYCLAAMDEDKYEVNICSEYFDYIFYRNYNIYNYVENHESIRVIYYIVSISFLMSIFVVYSILPELRNEHGFMLRNYSGALSVAYITDIITIIIKVNDVDLLVCVTVGTVYLNHITMQSA